MLTLAAMPLVFRNLPQKRFWAAAGTLAMTARGRLPTKPLGIWMNKVKLSFLDVAKGVTECPSMRP